MEITTFIALYSNSSTVGPSHASLESQGCRSFSGNHSPRTMSKPVQVVAMSPQPPDQCLAGGSLVAVRAAFLCSWDSDQSTPLSTPGQPSPVSVLAGNRHGTVKHAPFLLEKHVGNSCLVSSSTAGDQRSCFSLTGDVHMFGAVRSIQALMCGEPCESRSVILDLEVLRPHIEKMGDDLLCDAQRKYDVFRDATVIDAFRKAEDAHRHQFRTNGDPYLIHCAETALILAAIGASKVVVAAGLLHDTMDDTEVDYQDLQDMFGSQVADLVEGVTKLSGFSKLARDNDTANKSVEADRLHTMFLAMADARVVLIKLADRLHNMRTLGSLSEYKQKRIAKETLEVFVPLANRLGVSSWKAELEDLCFKYLHSVEHQELSRKLAGGFREATIMSSIERLRGSLQEQGLKCYDIHGRCKNLYGIYCKMTRKNKSFEEVHDVRGLRLVVENKQDCYTALEVVHGLWPCIPGKVKDYIDRPRPNGYQSLHTVVCGDDGLPLEVQIRTKDMNYQAELGVAAHWRYKEGNVEHSEYILQMVKWARWMLTWQNEVIETKTQATSIKVDSSRTPCVFPHHKQGCPHSSECLQLPPQKEGSPMFVIVVEDDKMMVQELPYGSTVADLLQRRVAEDSFAATGGVAFCEELHPKVNHKTVVDIHQCLKMGDLVEITPSISDESLLESFRQMCREGKLSGVELTASMI